MNPFLADLTHELKRHKSLADKAMAELNDAGFFNRPAAHANSVAIIVKHLAGNLVSRFTDFLTTDGEKPNRDRDNEFVLGTQDSRANLLAAWERGWQTLFNSVERLTPSDLDKTVTIRAEAHSVRQALLRALAHVAYHTGQILYLVRLIAPTSAWLTVEPGKSQGHAGNYLSGNR